jgi:hypothetical protein
MKKVDIIPIAERKLARRGIKRELVEDAVINPAQIAEGVRAVYEETEEMFIVVTAYLTSQINRYWKEGNRWK